MNVLQKFTTSGGVWVQDAARWRAGGGVSPGVGGLRKTSLHGVEGCKREFRAALVKFSVWVFDLVRDNIEAETFKTPFYTFPCSQSAQM